MTMQYTIEPEQVEVEQMVTWQDEEPEPSEPHVATVLP